jgi:serine protease
VGATNSDDNKASYSNYGNKLDLVAPGGEDRNNNDELEFELNEGILSTNRFNNIQHDGYNYWLNVGTSLSAPQVSGVAALMISAGVSDPDMIKDMLKNTSISLDDSYLWNAGLLNADAAVEAAIDYSFSSQLIQVMATIKIDNTYYIASDEVTADEYNQYYIPKCKTEENLTVIGWIDNNENNRIDSGDYFGEYDGLYLEQGDPTLENINFEIFYQDSFYTLSNQKPEIVDGPPPSKSDKK